MADVKDAASTWRFIERFAEKFTGRALKDGDGYSDTELDKAGKRLDLTLPKALRDLYALFGRRDDLTRVQDRLLRPRELEVRDDVLVFRAEAQNVTRWGVKVSDLDRPDPPVVYLHQDGDWRPYLDRVSWAAIEMALQEWLFSGDDNGKDNDNRPVEDDGSVTKIEKRYRRLPLPDYPSWASTTPDDAPVRWFSGEDVVVRDDCGDWLWFRTLTPEAIAEVRRAFRGDWIMSEPA